MCYEAHHPRQAAETIRTKEMPGQDVATLFARYREMAHHARLGQPAFVDLEHVPEATEERELVGTAD